MPHVTRQTTRLCTAVIISILGLAACTPDDEGHDNPSAPRNENANKGNGYARLLEIPALDETNLFVTHTTNYKGRETVTYSLEYDVHLRHSRWVAFECYDVVNEKHWYRSNWYNTTWQGDPFQSDPSLPADVCPGRSDFSGSGGVRGHLCASEDRIYSKEANEQTFYYSNMSPMNYDFNGGFWCDLEIAVRDAWAHQATFCDTLFVVKGGTVGPGEYRMSNNGRLPVPNHYFMALLCKKNASYKSIGFWVEHQPHVSGTIADKAVSIDQLEELTGIDFFCNLPDKTEEAVEASCYPSVWGL